MTEEELRYFRKYPRFYCEILAEVDKHPALLKLSRKIREAVTRIYPDSYVNADLTRKALLTGVARGIEWLGSYGKDWARMVYAKRHQLGREINAEEERAIRKEIWLDYVRIQAQRQGRKIAILDEEDMRYAGFLLAELPWPRNLSLGKFHIEEHTSSD